MHQLPPAAPPVLHRRNTLSPDLSRSWPVAIEALQFVFVISTFANGDFMTGGLFAIWMRMMRWSRRQAR